MTLTEAIKVVRESTLDNPNFVAQRVVFTALETIVEVAERATLETERTPDAG